MLAIKFCFPMFCIFSLTISQYAFAEKMITIGKGSGIVWTGMPFNVTLQSSIGSEHNGYAAVAAIQHHAPYAGTYCTPLRDFSNYGGYKAVHLSPGLGIAVRAKVTSTYQISPEQGGGTETLTGTIGLPDTRAVAGGHIIQAPLGFTDWCLTPRGTKIIRNFFARNNTVTTHVHGDIAIVANGMQVSTKIRGLDLYASMPGAGNNIYKSITSEKYTIRVSTLECNINTHTAINFGNVSRDETYGKELAVQTHPVVTYCTQSADAVNANINVQFEAISGYFNADPYKLSLKEGGGYITGEINDGVTGGGRCDSKTGVKFNDTQYKIGRITAGEASKITAKQITWRLCSGGATLPIGPVSAVTEMRVTFN